ncbi:MAG: hypothetical protein J7K82_01525 [Thermoproteales archaeon]|nr:hypothetical protein [Thermoproteales archaeon]
MLLLKVALSFEEFVLSLIIFLAVIVLLYILFHEYSVWRKKRLYKVIGR